MQLKNKQTSPPPQFIRDSKDDISGDWSRGSSAVGRTLELKYIKSRNFQYDRCTHEQYCFFRYMQYFHDISIDAIYRDIFYDIFQVKIGLKSSNFIPGAPMTRILLFFVGKMPF